MSTPPPRRRRSVPDRDDRQRPDRRGRTADQQAYDGPPIPDHITGRELDRSVASQLRGLPEKLAVRVARHLVAAGELLHSEPQTAYEHARAAKARAARLAAVREAVGETAYAAGHFGEALSELRAARRLNGAADYLPVMADCLRALGQPDEALKLIRTAPVSRLDAAGLAELRIVEAGARRDLGQVGAAVRLLEQQPLSASGREPWLVRLRYAYADALLAAGREAQALAWFHRTNAIDNDEITDAAARADELEARQTR